MRNLLIPIILLVISGLIGFFSIEPKYREIVAAQQNEESIVKDLGDAKAIVDIREAVFAEISNISTENLKRLEEILPGSIDPLRFLNTLQGIVGKRGLVMENAQVGSTEVSESEAAASLRVLSGEAGGAPMVRTLQARFSVEAEYETFKLLLEDLERSLMLIDVTAVTFSSSEETDLYKYGVSIQTYWRE